MSKTAPKDPDTHLRERIALANVPAAFAGAPIALITAGLLSLAFMGFAGLPVR